MNEQLDPTVFVIFGGAGDLTWRKLIPVLFDLSQDRSLPARFGIIAVAVARSVAGHFDERFPQFCQGTWQPENTQGLLSPGHRWPLPTELVSYPNKKKRQQSK